MANKSKIHLAVTLAVVVAFAVLLYVIFFMERSNSALLPEQRIDLQSMTGKRVPILLEFGKGWCQPCKYMKPILQDVAKDCGEKAIVATVDMDANSDLVRSFRVRVMPTQIFLWPDGREFFRNEGVLERKDIRNIFSKMGVEAAKAAPNSRSEGSSYAFAEKSASLGSTAMTSVSFAAFFWSDKCDLRLREPANRKKAIL